MAKDLKGILGDFLRIDGVSAAVVVGRDGFPIESALSSKVDVDGLGAMVATAIGTTEALGSEFALGGMEQFMVEFDRGKVLIAAAGDDILAIVTTANAVIGSVRYAVKKGLSDLIRAM